MPYILMSFGNPTDNSTGYVTSLEELGTFKNKEHAEQKRFDYLSLFQKRDPISIQIIEYTSKEDGI